MKFFWWGNIFMAMWSAVTIVAGVRYASSSNVNSAMATLGRVFDSLFGLDSCPLIPKANQNLSKLKEPCNFCNSATPYPHGGNSAFVINHGTVDVTQCTGVRGVGGANDSFVSGGAKLVDPVQYTNTILTGSPTGSISKGDYDKKRFKFGTPYIPRQSGDTIGYYYTTDTKGQEIPLIPPAIGTNVLPPALANNPAAFGATSGTHGFPQGWNAYVHYNNGTFGAAITPFSRTDPTNPTTTYSNPIDSSSYDPLTGFVVGKGWTQVNTEKSNEFYVSGPLAAVANPDKLKYKQFTQSSSSAHPAQWATFQ